jgi:cytochrome d ubiquinol oxidase subunit II
MLVLLVLILRTVALEFRSKEKPRAGGRLGHGLRVPRGLALLLGVASGTCVGAAGRCRRATSRSGLIGLLTPFAVLVGVTTVAMFAVQGGIYLMLKTEGELHDRIVRACRA